MQRKDNDTIQRNIFNFENSSFMHRCRQVALQYAGLPSGSSSLQPLMLFDNTAGNPSGGYSHDAPASGQSFNYQDPIENTEALIRQYDLLQKGIWGRGCEIRTAAALSAAAQGDITVQSMVTIYDHLRSRKLWGKLSDMRTAATLSSAAALTRRPVEDLVKAYDELRDNFWGHGSDVRAAAILSASAVTSGKTIKEALRIYDHLRDDIWGHGSSVKSAATIAAAAIISGKSIEDVLKVYYHLLNDIWSIWSGRDTRTAACLTAAAVVADLPVETVLSSYNHILRKWRFWGDRKAAATLAASSVQRKFVFVCSGDQTNNGEN